MKKNIDKYSEILPGESEEETFNSNNKNKTEKQSKWTGAVKKIADKQWKKHGNKVVSKTTKTISKKLKIDESVLSDLKTDIEEVITDEQSKVSDANKSKSFDASSIADKSGAFAGRFAKTAINQVLPGRAIKLGFW